MDAGCEVQETMAGRPDNGPLSRPPVVAIRTAQVSRTWPGVRRWTGGGLGAHPESVSERVTIACRDSGRVTGCETDQRRPL